MGGKWTLHLLDNGTILVVLGVSNYVVFNFFFFFSFLFLLQDKSGPHKAIYPYLLQELQPTLNELGITTPEELGIDKL